MGAVGGEKGGRRGGVGGQSARLRGCRGTPHLQYTHIIVLITHTLTHVLHCVCGNTYVADVLVTPRNLQIFVGRSVEGVVPRLARRLRVEGGRRYFPASSVSKSREADSVDP